MTNTISPEEIHHTLGIQGPPARLPMINDLRAYFGVKVQQERRRSGSIITYRPGGTLTITLGRAPTLERRREEAAHEFGHIGAGHIGPERPILYSRGKRRGANPPAWVETEADGWGRGWLVPRGSLHIAINHDERRSTSELARLYVVGPTTITKAAIDYGLGHLLIRDEVKLWRFYQSVAWQRTQREFLRAHPICERPACGRPSFRAHHTRYDRYDRCLPQDLEALCWDCHADTHMGAYHPGQLTLAVA